MSITTFARFAEALTATEPAPPAGLSAWNGAPDRRFEVYRNNRLMGLTGALASRFPVVEKLVGEDFFRAMAEVFIDAHPPLSPLLLAYGDGLPAFIEAFQPAESLPYLGDVARLEIARSRAYHAADARRLSGEALASVAAEHLAEIRFVAHPSLSVLRSPHPVLTIWAMNAGERPLGPIEDWAAEDIAVARPDMSVEARLLPPGGCVFVTSLAAGATLGDAVQAATAERADFDLSANLVGLIEAGLFTCLQPPGDPS